MSQTLALLIAILMLSTTISSCQESLQRKEEEIKRRTIEIDKKLSKLATERDAFEDQWKKIKDENIKTEFKDLGRILFGYKSTDLKSKRPPEKIEYEANSLAVLEDYTSKDDLIESYLEGIVVQRGEINASMKLPVMRPFKFPFTNRIEWEKIGFDNGINVPFLSNDEENEDKIRVLMSKNYMSEHVELHYPKGASEFPIPLTLSGELVASLPKDIHRFTFNKDDVGTTKELANVSVTLTAINGHYAQMKIEDAQVFDKDIVGNNIRWFHIKAADETEKNLKSFATWSGPDTIFNFCENFLERMLENEALALKFEDELLVLQKENSEKFKNTYFQTTYFHGSIEELVVYVFDYSTVKNVSKKISLPIQKFDKWGKNDTILTIKTNATVYDHEIPIKFNQKWELTEEEVQTKVNTGIFEDPVSYRNYGDLYTIYFYYPKLFSDDFFYTHGRFNKIKNIEFRSKGKPILIPQEHIDMDGKQSVHSDTYVEFNQFRIDFYPEKFKAFPDSVKGTIEIAIADIAKASYSIEGLPSGIKLIDNQLRINTDLYKEQTNHFFVKDASGKYLKQFSKAEFSRRGLEVYYFYGKPSVVEHLYLAGTKDVEYDFVLSVDR